MPLSAMERKILDFLQSTAYSLQPSFSQLPRHLSDGVRFQDIAGLDVVVAHAIRSLESTFSIVL